MNSWNSFAAGRRADGRSGAETGEVQKQMACAQLVLRRSRAAEGAGGNRQGAGRHQKTQMDMELRTKEAQAKAQADASRIGLELEQTRGSIAETNARIEKIMAEIQ